MRLIKPLTILGCIMCLCGAASASNLGFGATSFSQDTLNIGDTLHIFTSVKNYDAAAYNSTLSFKLKINGVLNANPNLFPNPVAGQQLNLAAGDSLDVEMIVVITPAYFLVGPDILVVWPYPTDGSLAHDSIIKQIYVQDYGTGINDDDKGVFIRSWFANGEYHIYNDGINIDFNRVSFYDMLGQQVLDAPISGNASVPFSSFPNGTYIAVITYNGKQRKLVKFNK